MGDLDLTGDLTRTRPFVPLGDLVLAAVLGGRGDVRRYGDLLLMGDLERDDLLLLARTGENDRDDLLLPPRIGDNDRDDLLLIGDLERAGDLARTGVIEKTSTQTYEEQRFRFCPFSLRLK